MTDDAFSQMDPEDIEEQAEGQINSVLEEILGEQFAGVGQVSTKTPEVKKVRTRARVAVAVRACVRRGTRVDASRSCRSPRVRGRGRNCCNARDLVSRPQEPTRIRSCVRTVLQAAVAEAKEPEPAKLDAEEAMLSERLKSL